MAENTDFIVQFLVDALTTVQFLQLRYHWKSMGNIKNSHFAMPINK